MHKSILFFLIVFAGFFAQAQELNCEVTVDAVGLQVTDPSVIQTLEQEISKFMNERVWTDDNFSSDERIKCQLVIAITEDPGNDVFKATASTSLSRPVFNADYETTLYNGKDESWAFVYRQFDDMNFNENAYTSELTSLLAYYAYLFIGTYYDSFSPSGGSPYFLKAQTLVNLAQNNSASKSWDPFGGKVTRYTYIENILNSRYKGMRDTYYEYHRNGLDKMYEDEQAGLQAIVNCLDQLEQVYKSSPNTMVMQTFFRAKTDELVKVLQNASNAQKPKILKKLSTIRPSEISTFQQILQRAQ